jgi:hypothetical protein
MRISICCLAACFAFAICSVGCNNDTGIDTAQDRNAPGRPTAIMNGKPIVDADPAMIKKGKRGTPTSK